MKPYRITIILSAIAILSSVSSVLAASYTLGYEFQLNTYTSQTQTAPYVSSNGDGYVVIWQSTQGGSAYNVIGQKIDAAGNAQGGEFQINTATGVYSASSASASNGQDYLVTWQGGDNNDYGICAQVVDASGSLQGSEFGVNTYTTAAQADVAVASNGQNYLVTWDSYGQDGSQHGIYGQLVNSSGTPQGTEFQVNTYTDLYQRDPAVASNGQNYLVAWASYGQEGVTPSDGVYAQLIDATGVAIGDEFRVNSYTSLQQEQISIASNGEIYLVTWQSNAEDGNGFGIYGQFLDASGNTINNEFRINTYTTSHQMNPSIASNGEDFVVVWESSSQDGSDFGIFAQLIDSEGNFIDDEFRVSSYTIGAQSMSSVASNGDDFLIAWRSSVQDSGSVGVYGALLSNNNSVSSVPEPTSILLLVSAMITLSGKYLRK